MRAPRRSVSVSQWTLAASVAAAAAIGGVFVLAAIARPTGLADRLAAVQQDANQARQLFRRKSVEGPAADAICRSSVTAAAPKLKGDLAALAVTSGLARPVIDVRPGASRSGGRLSELALRIEGQGSYEAALGLLSELSGMRPAIFLDTVDVRSATSFVTIAISGRAYCSASD